MSELKISEIIKRERKRIGISQEKLAEELTVSGQAVSNWERGGYPDIELLPRIAHFFGITVDELIGSDEASREADIESFRERCDELYREPASRVALAREYYKKYPRDYEIMWTLGSAIVDDMDNIVENRATLREISGKIIEGCTYEPYRSGARDWLYLISADDEEEKNMAATGRDWGEDTAKIEEMKEERLWRQRRYDEYRAQREKTDLLYFTHYVGREDSRMAFETDGERLSQRFADPEHTAKWEMYKIKLLEVLGSAEHTVPDGWLGAYGDAHLKAAGALCAVGKVAEGFAMLEKSLDICETWRRFPRKSRLPLGDTFGFPTVEIHGMTNIYYPDGSTSWAPETMLFWWLPGDIVNALETWHWFDGVRGDERFASALARAKSIKEPE